MSDNPPDPNPPPDPIEPPDPVEVVPAPPAVAAAHNPLRTWWWLPTIVVLAIAALAIALQTAEGDTAATPGATSTPGGETDSDPDEPATTPSTPVEIGSVEVFGEPLPRFADPDPAVGSRAPTFTGSNVLTGEPESIRDDGTARIVMFVAHWCPHCQAEVPRVAQHLAATGMPETVEIVVVSTAVDANAPNYPPSAWLVAEQWPTVAVADDADLTLAASYGLTGYPYFVALDDRGRVIARASGELSTDAFDALVAAAAG